MSDAVAGELDPAAAGLPPGRGGARPGKPVFGEPTSGEPLGYKGMYRRLREALTAAGLDPAFGFHSLRHGYGTALAAQGVPMRALQEWMGDRDSQTTQRYADYCPNPPERDVVDAAFARGTNPGTNLRVSVGN